MAKSTSSSSTVGNTTSSTLQPILKEQASPTEVEEKIPTMRSGKEKKDAYNVGTTSSTKNATSTSSTSEANSAWANFNRLAAENGGYFNVPTWMDFEEICRWLTNSPTDVQSNTTPETFVILSRIIGNNDTKALADALKSNNTIKHLNLLYSAFGSEGIKALAEALNSNKTLESLELIKSQIDVEGVKALGEMLKSNSTLKTLNLNGIAIDAEGFKALADGLKDNKTLTKLVVDYPPKLDTIYKQKIDNALNRNRRLDDKKNV